MYLINHTILGSDQSTVVLSGIPQSYAHLLLKVEAKTDRTTATFDNIRVNLNGVQSGSSQWFYGNGGSVSAGTEGFPTAYVGTIQAYWSNTSIYIYDYTSSNSNKSIQGDSVAYTNSFLSSAAWSQSQAVSSITLAPGDGTVFKADSVFSLYAIPSGSGGSASIT